MPSNPFRIAATASWLVFFVAIASNAVLRPAGLRVISDLIALPMLIIGFALGVVALFGIGRHGRKGILIPALIGMLLNGLFLFVWVTNFLAAVGRSRGAR